MPKSAVRLIVRGLVQGVGFRYFVHRHAASLGLDGYARNLPTGEVEVVLAGEKGLVNDLVKTIRIGPRYASVSDVSMTEIPIPDNMNGFSIR